MSKSYWNGNGKYQSAAERLQKRIPSSGPVAGPKNRKLEKYRKAVNAYYDLYNNGGGNRPSAILSIFGINSSDRNYFDLTYLYRITEPEMDRIIVAAAAEQGLVEELV